jgi:hypothetical protein
MELGKSMTERSRVNLALMIAASYCVCAACASDPPPNVER